MAVDRLIVMANQIGAFFVTQPRASAPEAIANHLRKFWDPRMRDEIRAHEQNGGAGLDPPVREAVRLLATPPGK
ncbi:MAG: formate dehydrogenase subunit delta [Rhizobiales bacterium]|nr:formate dehydrogenase subunit delta [Hyphomicrobiales bacterium]